MSRCCLSFSISPITTQVRRSRSLNRKWNQCSHHVQKDSTWDLREAPKSVGHGRIRYEHTIRMNIDNAKLKQNQTIPWPPNFICKVPWLRIEIYQSWTMFGFRDTKLWIRMTRTSYGFSFLERTFRDSTASVRSFWARGTNRSWLCSLRVSGRVKLVAYWYQHQ